MMDNSADLPRENPLEARNIPGRKGSGKSGEETGYCGSRSFSETVNYGFLFELENPNDFILSDWQIQRRKPNCLYIALRVFIAVWMVTWEIIKTGWFDTEQYFVYLSNWTQILLTLDAVLNAFVVVGAHVQNFYEYEFMPNMYKLLWIISNTCYPATLVAGLVFISFLDQSKSEDPMDRFNTFNIHGINILFVLVIVCVEGKPLRFQHFYCVILYGVGYMIFAITFFFVGGVTDENSDKTKPPNISVNIYFKRSWARNELIAWAGVTAAMTLSSTSGCWFSSPG